MQAVLPVRSSGEKLRGDERVGSRIPAGVIGAVEDTEEIGAAIVKVHGETLTADGAEDFRGVRGRDGGQRVGEEDAAFEEVGFAEVLKFFGGEMFRAEAEIGHDVGVVFALITDIVDREHAGGVRERRENAVPGFEEGGRIAVGQSWACMM